MRVRSPVGEFPLRLEGIAVEGGALRLRTSLGAWQSELRFERGDAGLALVAAGVLASVYLAGRRSARR